MDYYSIYQTALSDESKFLALIVSKEKDIFKSQWSEDTRTIKFNNWQELNDFIVELKIAGNKTFGPEFNYDPINEK